MKKNENKDRGRPSALVRRITAAALACTMAFSAMPAAALSPLADEEGALGALTEGSTANEEDLQEPSAPVMDDVQKTEDGAGAPEDGRTDDDPQEPSTDALEPEEGEEALKDDLEADLVAQAEEEGQTDEWLRPAAGEAIPLTVSNAAFKPAGSIASAYPVMQACTSHLLGLPTIIAYGTPLGGHDFAAEEGVAVSSIVASTIVESTEGQYAYWKTNLLDIAAGECQTLETNANATAEGVTVSRIRYNARAESWEVLPREAGAAWMAIQVGAHAQQLVFYYQKTADLDENVSLSNDNHYLTPEMWQDPTSWARNNKDAVCLLYQLYDESGAIIANIPATEAYYYSHTNAQDITVSLSERLTGKYEIAKVSWDAYQEYICYGKTYHQTCPGFRIPERFESLSNAEAEHAFTINLPETACTRYENAAEHVEHPMHGGSAQTAAQSCTQYHQGLFVVGIMVRALPSDHGITVRYWGGQPDDAVELDDISLRVAGSDPYDWEASGYEIADAIDVVTDLPYHGQNVVQEVSLGLPVAYAGCYAADPSVRILDGNVLDLYFSPIPLTALVGSDPVCKVYDGKPLAPAPAQVTLPDGFTCVLDPGAVVGERIHAGITEPELDWTRVHIYKEGQPADIKTAFSFEAELGTVEVMPRRIELVAEDAIKTYGQPDPAFSTPEVKLLSPEDGFPAIIEGDDLDPRTVRDGDEEDVRISEHGNVVAYREVLDPVWNGSPDYEVTATPAHFTIRPARVVIYVWDVEKAAGQPDEDEEAGRTFGGIIEGLLGDDVLGTITYVRTNADVEEVGVYSDVLTAEVEDENRNYTYVVVNGTFTITDGTEGPERPDVPGTADPEGPGETEGPEEPAGPGDPADPEKPADNAVILIDVDGIPVEDANDHDGEGWKKTYDGHEMQANAVAEKPGSTLLYAVDEPQGWTDANPAFTEVGSHTVYIKATNPSYADTDPIAVDMAIVPRLVTIRAYDATKEYGETDPEFSGEVKNLVRKDDLGQITYHRTNDDEAVGTYPQVIDASYQSNPNYQVAVSLGTMDISPNSVIVEGVTGAGSFIEDALTPLTSRFDPHDHSCWIHWWMLLGILVTLICAAGSLLHRRKHIRALDGMEDEVRDRFENTPRA